MVSRLRADGWLAGWPGGRRRRTEEDGGGRTCCDPAKSRGGHRTCARLRPAPDPLSWPLVTSTLSSGVRDTQQFNGEWDSGFLLPSSSLRCTVV
ncbi:hypothetical protein GN956_G16203 [Arapaima gigas]